MPLSLVASCAHARTPSHTRALTRYFAETFDKRQNVSIEIGLWPTLGYAARMRRITEVTPRGNDVLGRVPLVLVVDDDASTAEHLAAWLLGQGFNAVAATSWLEARAVLDATAPGNGKLNIDALIGQIGLRDGSFFELAQELRVRRHAVVIGYADVAVERPPELDACFVRPLDLKVLGSFLAVRFGRRRSGEHAILDRRRSVPPARVDAPEPTSSTATRRRR
jgi:CheY-like chemotaxis protein